jgi:hypothetical protein
MASDNDLEKRIASIDDSKIDDRLRAHAQAVLPQPQGRQGEQPLDNTLQSHEFHRANKQYAEKLFTDIHRYAEKLSDYAPAFQSFNDPKVIFPDFGTGLKKLNNGNIDSYTKSYWDAEKSLYIMDLANNVDLIPSETNLPIDKAELKNFVQKALEFQQINDDFLPYKHVLGRIPAITEHLKQHSPVLQNAPSQNYDQMALIYQSLSHTPPPHTGESFLQATNGMSFEQLKNFFEKHYYDETAKEQSLQTSINTNFEWLRQSINENRELLGIDAEVTTVFTDPDQKIMSPDFLKALGKTEQYQDNVEIPDRTAQNTNLPVFKLTDRLEAWNALSSTTPETSDQATEIVQRIRAVTEHGDKYATASIEEVNAVLLGKPYTPAAVATTASADAADAPAATDEASPTEAAPAVNNNTLTNRILAFQKLSNLEQTGKYEDIQNHLSQYYAEHVLSFIASTGPEIRMSGQRYKVDIENGDIFEYDKEKYEYKTEPSGNIKNAGPHGSDKATHPITLLMLGKMQKSHPTILDFDEKHKEDQTRKQIEILNKHIPGSQGKEEPYLEALHNSSSQKDFYDRFVKTAPKAEVETLENTNMLMVLIGNMWGTEVSRRNPSHVGIVNDEQNNKEFHILGATYDIAHNSAKGTTSNSLSTFARSPENTVNRQNHSFFGDPAIYKSLKERNFVSGAIIGKPGSFLSRNALAKVAAERIDALAKAHGIPLKDVSKAIAEGRLTPDQTDLQLVKESFLSVDDLTPDDISEDMTRFLKDSNIWKKHEKMPDQSYLQGILEAKRNAAFNEKYGSLADSDFKVSTIVEGQDLVRTGMDLAFNTYRAYNRRQMDVSYGEVLDKDNSLQTFDEAIDALKKAGRDDLAQSLSKEVKNLAGNISIVTYFQGYNDGYTSAKDYHTLQTQRYEPALKAKFTPEQLNSVYTSASSPPPSSAAQTRQEITETKNEITGDKAAQTPDLTQPEIQNTATLNQSL